MKGYPDPNRHACVGCGSPHGKRRRYGRVELRHCEGCADLYSAGFELGLAEGAATARRNAGLPDLERALPLRDLRG